jgi:hypothetical protein
VLLLLSGISSIFNNNMPIIGVSAQDYGLVNDYGSSYENNNNGMVESYSYEEPNIYNTDTGYRNFDPSIVEQNSEYSSYDNSYGPPTPDYGDGNVEDYSSYDNSYGPPTPDYGDGNVEDYSSYDNFGYPPNNYYDEASYDSNYYPPMKPQKFTCPDSGLVVDKPESCPVICPVESTLQGHFVAAGSNLTQICNVDKQVLETCGPDTDLRGVFVTDATPEQCNIFATCDFRTPLGEALGLNSTQTVEVADAQLCELDIPDVPPPTQLFTCPSEPTEDVPFPNSNMAGELVTSLELCQVATPAVLCPVGTPLNGTWVNPNSTKTCNIEIPRAIDLDVCPARSPENPNVNPDLEGALVTDERLCEAPTAPNICPEGTDLAGVYANITATDTTACDIDVQIDLTTNLQAQCLKCADLAVFAASPTNAGNFATAASELRGSTTSNIFTVCDDANPRTGFNALVGNSAVETAFDTCLDNAGVNPGNGTSSLSQAQALSLQENSVTTNVKSEAEIPTVSESVQALESALQENSVTTNVKPGAETSTFDEKMSPPPFFPPKIAQEIEDSSSTLTKIDKLKQQWLDLLP